MILGVVVPTVAGRDDFLERALRSHNAGAFLVGGRVVVRVERGHPTCAEAWNAGAAELEREHGSALRWLCFTADDLEAHPGWWLAAVAACTRGVLPAPMLYTPTDERDPRTDDGEPGSPVPFSRVPFLPVELWRTVGPLPPLHYYSDVELGARAGEHGYTFRVTDGYAFTHHWAAPGRRDSDEGDRRLLERLRAQP